MRREHSCEAGQVQFGLGVIQIISIIITRHFNIHSKDGITYSVKIFAVVSAKV